MEQSLRNLYWRLTLSASPSTDRVSVNQHDSTFHVTTKSEHWLFRNKDLGGEREIIKHFLSHIEDDDAFCDIGGNIGMYPCFASNILPDENIIIFEPHPDNVQRLKENLDINNVDARVCEVALSNFSGTAEFTTSSDPIADGNHSFATSENDKTITVNVEIGDDLITKEELPSPDVVKIDVEGAELQVLEGLEQTLVDNCHTLYCEVHPEEMRTFDSSPNALYTLLRDLGFDIEVINERENVHTVFAQRSVD